MKRILLRIFTASLFATAMCIAPRLLIAQNPEPPIPVAKILSEPPVLGKKEKHHRHADAFFAGPIVHLEFTFKPAD